MLKKYLLITFIFLCNSAFCQENINNSIQLSPTHFTNIPIGIAYQRALNNYFNIEATVSFSMYDQLFIYYDYSNPYFIETSPGYFEPSYPGRTEYIDNALEFGLGIGFIYRPFGNRLKGFYLELGQGINICTLIKSNNLLLYFPTEFQLGYQWLFKQGITISLGLGLIKINNISEDKIIVDGIEYNLETENTFFDLFSFRIRLGVGYSW